MGGVPAPSGCWGQSIGLGEVRARGSARQGEAGEGGCSSLCPSWIPLEKGLQEGRRAGKSSLGRGNHLFQAYEFPCDESSPGGAQEEVPAPSTAQPQHEVPGSTTQ